MQIIQVAIAENKDRIRLSLLPEYIVFIHIYVIDE
jgi:hypothetical protein